MTDFGDLSGRSIVVTGAGRGLGLAIAHAVANAGAVVHAADVIAERVDAVVSEIEAGGGSAVGHVVDIAAEDSVAAMFDEIDGPIWDRLLAVNLTGTWLVSKHAAPRLIAQQEGRIVNLASDAALYGSPRLSHYIASKGAVISLTRAMARELGPHGITVNGVAPGIVEGESTVDVPLQRHQLYADLRALQRPQQSDDVVGIVRFLLSDDAAYLTGTTQVVDGGFVMP